MEEIYPADDTTSFLAQPIPHRFELGQGYTLRRHRYEQLGDEGTFNCRRDWVKYIGPIGPWGNSNPWDGNFCSVVMPFCKPERLSSPISRNVLAFMYDNVLESAAQAAKALINTNTEDILMDEHKYRTIRSTIGTKQIQAKMMLDLLLIDKPCGEAIINEWKRMVKTTAGLDKARHFKNLDDYIEYRIVDTGAPFTDCLMRFGTGILLFPEEQEHVYPIVRPCYAALGLANDFYSFDVEYDELCNTEATSMTNCIWLYMQWENLPIAKAKERVREITSRYEAEFLERSQHFCENSPCSNERTRYYLHALAHMVTGNISWSQHCPRYHPALRDGASKCFGLADGVAPSPEPEAKLSKLRTDQMGLNREDTIHVECTQPTRNPSYSSGTSISEFSEKDKRPLLGTEHVYAPFEYISPLPSKGIRDSFIDSLNTWLGSPERVVNQVKSIISTLHNASLILDDIQDASPIRRGKPAAHTVFGHGPSINSANFLIFQALDEARKLDSPNAVDIFVEQMQTMHVGQSFDLYWARHNKCPSEAEYLEMVRCKTGGLFRFAVRLLLDSRHQNNRHLPLDHLADLLGQLFQIRDDYKNLVADEYTVSKGFCEDLDEGKFSFPLIHTLNTQPNPQIEEILHEGRVRGGLSKPMKLLVLEQIRKAGSMEYSEKRLSELVEQVREEIEHAEDVAGCTNWALRLVLYKLEE
ncbi:geranylgeranyl pyrophosphate synthase [Aspergillus steynii IBT 23096]|uniref:Geranylgeranyl pyrophosphate synthase n=1 Tax=Aspergillus steynii IBT 23096 TaxID=1392250 RepID=A0A2I2GBW8_9EURO|nr:geranylgeranyl pyrophosphate synthase [Aspergillus steynii IBT 23096]PLB50378.1 geranylgeranyl pyrophosphate synthase [Aspergillus steynii IBT 23096]